MSALKLLLLFEHIFSKSLRPTQNNTEIIKQNNTETIKQNNTETIKQEESPPKEPYKENNTNIAQKHLETFKSFHNTMKPTENIKEMLDSLDNFYDLSGWMIALYGNKGTKFEKKGEKIIKKYKKRMKNSKREQLNNIRKEFVKEIEILFNSILTK